MVWYKLALWILLLLHLLCCLLIFLGVQFRVLKVRKILVPVALLLPLWGELLVVVQPIQILCKQTDRVAVGVEKFQVESELYKGIQRDDGRSAAATVSMEEALIVNTPKERRALMMDILNDDPKAYVEFLKLAGNNDDTEVVHYAVSAMVQISKENDQTLWELEQQYAQHQDDPDALTAYSEFLWHCLEQGLMQGQVEQRNRSLYDTLIQKKIRQFNASLTDYIRDIENNMTLRNYTVAGMLLDRAEEIWPWNEEVLIARIQYLADLEQGDALQALLAELEEKHIYLSAKGKEVIAFWKD